MASRISEAEDLATRCERAGWTVDRKNRSSIKVTTPNGIGLTIHRTMSDRNGLEATEREFNRHGLAEAEKAAADLAERERISAILRDADINQRKLEAAEAAAKNTQAITQRAALARASGNYMPVEDVELEWFTQKHPSMWTRIALIDYKIADYLLTFHNNINRPIKPVRWQHYRDIILSGQWRTTHQGGAIDSNADLQDCQHRFMGIRAACEQVPDLKVPMMITVGVDPDNFKAIDEGLLRSAADLFGRAQESYAGALSSLVRFVIALKDDSPKNRLRQRTTNAQVVDFFEANDTDDLRVSARYGVLNNRKVKCNATALAAAHYTISKANAADPTYVEAFFEGLTTGDYAHSRHRLPADDSRAALRRQFENFKEKKIRIFPIAIYSMIVHGWNNVVTGRTPHTITIIDEAAVPQPIISQPNPEQPDATPRCLTPDMRYLREEDKEYIP